MKRWFAWHPVWTKDGFTWLKVIKRRQVIEEPEYYHEFWAPTWEYEL